VLSVVTTASLRTIFAAEVIIHVWFLLIGEKPQSKLTLSIEIIIYLQRGKGRENYSYPCRFSSFLLLMRFSGEWKYTCRWYC
jgi:hypothetical protein